MKLFRCWFSITVGVFGYGEKTTSSIRIESNFNNLKHIVCNNVIVTIRVDNFVEKLINYYKCDHLILLILFLKIC
jgi:hypothetical protein